MANEIDSDDMMARLVAIEEEMVQSDAVPYPFHKQEGFPYWTNYMPTLALDRGQNNFGEEAMETVPTIIATLAIGNMTSGVPGEREAEFMSLAFFMARYFNRRPKLQSSQYPEGMPYVNFLQCTNVARATGKGAAGDDVLLAVCTLVINMLEPLNYAYF